jgi:hypothetical protein
LPFSAPSEADAPAEAPDRDDVWPPSLPDPEHRSSAAALDRVEPPATDQALLPQLQALDERLNDRFRANRRGEASRPGQALSTATPANPAPPVSRTPRGRIRRLLGGEITRRLKGFADWI